MESITVCGREKDVKKNTGKRIMNTDLMELNCNLISPIIYLYFIL
jgi:hypothetical protein